MQADTYMHSLSHRLTPHLHSFKSTPHWLRTHSSLHGPMLIFHVNQDTPHWFRKVYSSIHRPAPHYIEWHWFFMSINTHHTHTHITWLFLPVNKQEYVTTQVWTIRSYSKLCVIIICCLTPSRPQRAMISERLCVVLKEQQEKQTGTVPIKKEMQSFHSIKYQCRRYNVCVIVEVLFW